MDFDKINAAALQCVEALIHAWFPAARREGPEWKVGSLQGEEGRSLSINSRTGVWKDFSSDETGRDLISLLAAIRGCKMGEAAKELDAMLNLGEFKERAVPQTNKPPEEEPWEPLPFAPQDAPEPSFVHHRLGRASKVWPYPDAQGRIIGYVCRFELPDGGKDVVPLSWCRHAVHGQKWRWKSFGKPRPIYGLDKLAAMPSAPVVIVEGEKCADAMRELFAKVVVISWPGGGKAVKYVDWTPLAERNVTIWPDADAAGVESAETIRGILESSAASVRVIQVSGKPKGWDVADAISEGWGVAEIRNALTSLRIGEPEPEPEPERGEEPAHSEEESESWRDESAPEPTDDKWPFRILGYNKGTYFYLPDGAQQIVELTPSEHRELPLLQLAPAAFWEANFPTKDGANWKAAANSLIQFAHRQGMFSHKLLRGRGAWIDNGATVYHLGDSLSVDGVQTAIRDHKSRYVYELAEHIDAPELPPAASAESVKLIRLCELMPFKHPLNSKLLAGWLVTAPISGVLTWRPHVWINGPSGTGKSWILANVVQRIIGEACINVQSATTEAGIRQSLGSDSLPVIFDEAESEDKRGQQRIQSILELARGASSETGAGIAKGTASGEAMVFRVRSAFCFASIGVAAVQKADISRISSLELQKQSGGNGAAAFAELKRLVSETTAQAEWCEALRARSLSLAAVIRENASVFSHAVALHLGDQRVGDQLGTLLAGAFSLSSPKAVTKDFAAEWVSGQDWGMWTPVDSDKDEIRAFSMLCEAIIRVEGEHSPRSISVGELVVRAIEGCELTGTILIRHGIKIRRDNTVAVSNSHDWLRRVYGESPWAQKWAHQLLRLDGAESAQDRFNGPNQRAVLIPNSFFL